MGNSYLVSSVQLHSVTVLQFMVFWAGSLCFKSLAVQQDLRHKDPKLAPRICKTEPNFSATLVELPGRVLHRWQGQHLQPHFRSSVCRSLVKHQVETDTPSKKATHPSTHLHPFSCLAADRHLWKKWKLEQRLPAPNQFSTGELPFQLTEGGNGVWVMEGEVPAGYLLWKEVHLIKPKLCPAELACR